MAKASSLLTKNIEAAKAIAASMKRRGRSVGRWHTRGPGGALVMRINGRLCAVHGLSNVYHRRGRRVRYTRTCAMRSTLEITAKSIYYIKVPGQRRAKIVERNSKTLLSGFHCGWSSRQLYFPL